MKAARAITWAAAGTLIALLVLAALETALLVLGVEPRWDPLCHAYQRTRLFVPATVEGEPGWRTAPGYLRYFPAMSVRADPPPGTFRIVAAGGSFMAGWGLADPAAQSFVAGFGRRLEDARSGVHVEVVNCGAPGWAAYRIAPLVEELVRLRPDVLLVFTGHNEFWESAIHRDLTEPGLRAAKVVAALEPFRLFRLLGWTLDEANGRWPGWHMDWSGRYEPVDDRRFAAIRGEFGERLERIAETCRRSRVPVVFGTVPMNLRCDPDSPDSTCRGASRHPAGMSARARAEFDGLVLDGRAQWSARAYAPALARFRAAAKLDPGYGWLAFQEARCLEALGRPAEAREAYWRHLELCRRGVVREWNALIREAGRTHGVPVADAARWFEEGAPAGVAAAEWFLDDTHLNLRGQRRLAERMFAERARLLQNTVYMKGRVLEPAKMSSAAPSRRATSGTIHQARRSRANAARSANRRAV